VDTTRNIKRNSKRNRGRYRDLKDASDVLINLYHFFLRCRFQARRRIKRALVRLVPHLRQPVPCQIASVPEPWVHA
jgi:hypothetical protein